jgi:hypothetical protein
LLQWFGLSDVEAITKIPLSMRHQEVFLKERKENCHNFYQRKKEVQEDLNQKGINKQKQLLQLCTAKDN